MARTGRPKGEDPREYKLSIRFSEKERAELEKYAAENNITVTGAIRKGVDTDSRFWKILQKIMIDKTERHFDVSLQDLKAKDEE